MPQTEEKDMKVIKHTLYPISYIADDGTQVDTCWGHKPIGGEFWVGESFVVELLHPETMGEEARQAKIAELEAELEALKESAK